MPGPPRVHTPLPGELQEATAFLENSQVDLDLLSVHCGFLDETDWK